MLVYLFVKLRTSSGLLLIQKLPVQNEKESLFVNSLLGFKIISPETKFEWVRTTKTIKKKQQTESEKNTPGEKKRVKFFKTFCLFDKLLFLVKTRDLASKKINLYTPIHFQLNNQSCSFALQNTESFPFKNR